MTSTEFGRMKAAIEQVTAQFHRFDRSLREQRAGGSQVLDGLLRIKNIAEQVKNGSTEMMVGNKQILAGVELTDISGVTGGAVDEIAAAIVEIQNAMEEMLSVARPQPRGYRPRRGKRPALHGLGGRPGSTSDSFQQEET